MMMTFIRSLVCAAASLAWLVGCGQPDLNVSEKENPNYQKAQDPLRQGLEEMAMDEFQKVLDRNFYLQT